MITLTPLANPEGATQQEYNASQEVLIPIVNSTSEFDSITDQVIFSVETVTGDLLASKKISNFNIRNYKNTTDEENISSVVVFPIQNIKELDYNEGVYNVYYNFYKSALKSDQYSYFIQTISPSRTELRISVNNVPNEEVETLTQNFSSSLDIEGLFKDFYVEIGGSYYIANNILLDTSTEEYSILLKLYQPLPPSINIDDQLQVVFESAETVGFNINLPPSPIIIEDDVQHIKGPNFSYQLSDQVNNSTEEQDYNLLINNTQLTSSYNELENILNQKGITVNVDYTNFDNFIQFSSAEQRLLNFYYKVGQIESYNNNISSLLEISSPGGTVSSSEASYQSQITEIIQNFDGYENYLYYTSGTLAYPKSNSIQPYNLQSTGSLEVLEWLGSNNEDSIYYGGILNSASYYDDENQDNLWNTVPTYLREDPANSGYELFLNMIGQHFDILYSYINTLTDRFNADNRLDFGISKDLVADALRGAGLKLYQNNFSSDDLYSALLGINASGSLLPPTGSEVITNYVTSSNVAYPLEDVNKETYKRLYHNLPYLLNKKGTVAGLRALINCFGIPDTILRISEFGGKDKDNTNDWDYFQDRFSYSLYANSSAQVIAPWTSSLFSTEDAPDIIFFRFKTDGVRNSEPQVLLQKDSSDPSIPDFRLILQHTGSGTLTSGSYSGSIQSQSADYGTLEFSIGNPAAGISCSLNQPFFNGDWWSVGISKTRYEYTLLTGQNIYDGDDGFEIGYFTSSITPNGGVSTSNNSWYNSGSLKLGNEIPITVPYNVNNTLFQGYYQELRFYNDPLFYRDGDVERVFKDFVMNSTSLEARSLTGSNSSFNSLSFRAALGNELRTSGSLYIPNMDITVFEGGLPVNVPFSLPLSDDGFLSALSIHPAVTASSALLISQSFGNNSEYTISASVSPAAYLVGEKDFIYYDQPAVGIKNRISEKIRPSDLILPSGNTLSPYRSVQQNSPKKENYTLDTNYVEIAFSPQNEVNNDINSTLGYFNIGEYIGDPRQLSESVDSYPDLDKLRDTYFEKYYTNYDWKDYIRLIKYFDNSLFKMINDFIPAKTGLASGVVIKQHLLERNKVTPPQVTYSEPYYTGSIDTAFISGGTGGTFNELNRNFSNAATLIMREAESYVVDRSNLGSTVINGFGASFGSYGITGSDNGLEVQEVGQTTYPFINTLPIPVYFDFSLEGTVSGNNLNEGEIQIFSDLRFTTGSNKYLDKRNAGAIYSASLGDISVGNSISISATNLIIYPNERLSIAISDSDNSSEDIIPCSVTFSPTSTVYDPTLNSQIWSSSVDTLVGPQTILNSSQYEFYNGEFSGSEVLVTDGELTLPPPSVGIEDHIGLYNAVRGCVFEPEYLAPNEGLTSIDGFMQIFWPLYEFSDSTPEGYVRNPAATPVQIAFRNDDSGNYNNSEYFNYLSSGDTITLRQKNLSQAGMLHQFTIGGTSILETGGGTIKWYVFTISNYLPSTSPFNLVGELITTYGNPPYFMGINFELMVDASVINQEAFPDINPILNNAPNNRLSAIYQDVDYANNFITPVNFNLLLNGVGSKFPIPDSNYRQRGWSNGRYNGSRNSSTDFNK